MKIVVVGDFDPCGVHLRHRKFLRALGVDYTLGVREAYRKEAEEADCWLGRQKSRKGEYATFRWLARDADILQFLPAIGQPWSFQDLSSYAGRDAHDVGFGSIDWNDRDFRKPRKVVCFHGSRNAWVNRVEYTQYYRDRGLDLLATTLGYVIEMQAHYLPSIVDIVQEPRLREDGEPLRVIHSPTDPAICQSEEFLRLCSELKIVVTYLTGRSHEHILSHKRAHHLGFDHLRGDFSVNSLENTAFGIVNLVGVKPEYRDWLEQNLGVSLPWPDVVSLSDVALWLERFRDDAEETRRWQRKAIDWYRTEWTPEKNARRIVDVYERILAT